MEETKDAAGQKELQITRTFKAPVELIWDVFTKPEHIVNWWGPNGFTTTIHKMDITVGGEWLLTMHGPDGKDYYNRSVFRELIPLKKIVYEHFNPNFIATILFRENSGETTMEWRMTFETAALYEAVVHTYKADEGLKQNIDKLEKYITQKMNGNEK